MISAVRTNKPAAGFTLIEIVLVLAIASVVLGGAVGMMVYSSDERVLRNASGEVELLAKRARTLAILKQTPYALEFRESVVRLLPLAQAGLKEKRGRKAETLTEGSDDSRHYNFENGMAVSILRWNTETWLPTVKETVHVWRFDPDGLCEPLSIRYSLDKSTAEDIYHPLTATIRDSALDAR